MKERKIIMRRTQTLLFVVELIKTLKASDVSYVAPTTNREDRLFNILKLNPSYSEILKEGLKEETFIKKLPIAKTTKSREQAEKYGIQYYTYSKRSRTYKLNPFDDEDRPTFDMEVKKKYYKKESAIKAFEALVNDELKEHESTARKWLDKVKGDRENLYDEVALINKVKKDLGLKSTPLTLDTTTGVNY